MHLNRIYARLGVESRTAAVEQALGVRDTWAREVCIVTGSKARTWLLMGYTDREHCTSGPMPPTSLSELNLSSMRMRKPAGLRPRQEGAAGGGHAATLSQRGEASPLRQWPKRWHSRRRLDSAVCRLV
jgi:hypothetical protein